MSSAYGTKNSPRQAGSARALGLAPLWTAWIRMGGSVASIGLVLILANAVVLASAYGTVAAAAWSLATGALLIAAVWMGVRVASGASRLRGAQTLAHCVLIASWMGCAVAFWVSGVPGSKVIAFIICLSWSIHVVFEVRGVSRPVAAIKLGQAREP